MLINIFKIMIFVGIVFVSSCSHDPLKEREEVDLSIIGISQEEFDKNYGNPIELDDLVIRIKALPIPIADGEDFGVATSNQLRSDKPDVILTNGMVLPTLIREGLLMQIDSLVNVDTEQIEGIVPSIMQKVRNDSGDGSLYGLPTTFSSDVLYYNKDLFNEIDIPYPSNDISWSEALELEYNLLKYMVKRNEPVYGILAANVGEAASKLDQKIREYALAEAIYDIDSTNRRIKLDTEEWKRVWQEIISAYTNYSVIRESSITQFPYEDRVLSFTSQRSPIMIGGDYHWHNWMSTHTLSFDWGVASPPGKYNIYYQNIIAAISQDTSEMEAAWELIKYITSADVTEKMLAVEEIGKGYNGKFPARIMAMEERNKADLSAFYVKEPAISGLYSDSANGLSSSFYMEYRKSRVEHIQSILDGQMTVEEALTNLQQEAQSILDKSIKP